MPIHKHKKPKRTRRRELSMALIRKSGKRSGMIRWGTCSESWLADDEGRSR